LRANSYRRTDIRAKGIADIAEMKIRVWQQPFVIVVRVLVIRQFADDLAPFLQLMPLICHLLG